jgi:hypothetical protein
MILMWVEGGTQNYDCSIAQDTLCPLTVSASRTLGFKMLLRVR